MSRMSRQTPQNPFIAPESPYRCSEQNCFERGAWSPRLFGSGWFCAKHAEPLRVAMSESNSPAYFAFCQWWATFKRNPPECRHRDAIGDFVRAGAVFAPEVGRPLSESERELLEERAAIQAEGHLP